MSWWMTLFPHTYIITVLFAWIESIPNKMKLKELTMNQYSLQYLTGV